MSTLSCRKGGELMGARRAGLDAADRLRLEAHIAECPRCQEEADRLDVVSALLDSLPERVTDDARRSALLSRALDQASLGHARQRLAGPNPVRATLALAAAVTLMVGGYRLLNPGSEQAREDAPSGRVLSGVAQVGARALTEGSALSSGEELTTDAPATLRMGRAEIATGAHTRVRWNAADNTVLLLEGELRARVAHRPDVPFRVQAPSFTVEVTGTRFSVDETSVSVSEGSVRVLDRAGQVVAAALHAGDSYHLEQYETLGKTDDASSSASDDAPVDSHQASGTEPAAAETTTTDATRTTGSRPARGKAGAHRDRAKPDATATERPARPAPDTATLLQQARTLLAQRKPAAARTLVGQVLAGAASRGQLAEAETLLGDCARASGANAEAARHYARVARRYADLPAGQNALFAAARTHERMGDRDKSVALLLEYQRRYPSGLLHREVEQRLQVLSAQP